MNEEIVYEYENKRKKYSVKKQKTFVNVKRLK